MKEITRPAIVRFGRLGKSCLLLSLICLVSLGPTAFAQGTLPSLDNAPGTTSGTLTPAQDLSTRRTSSDDRIQPVSNTLLASPSQAVQSAVHHAKTGKAHPHGERGIHPVSYNPLPGIVIFPVIKQGKEKAFSDLPVIFAGEYAQKLEQKVPETKVYHPVYTVDELRMQGLGHVYDQIMSYYLKAGRPEPLAMDYLLKQISDNSKTISRVVFVEADLDTGHPFQSTGLLEWVKQLTTDGTPKQMRYFVHSRLQIFDAENPDMPMIWGGSWRRSIKTDQFFNVTPSVFADSDSQHAFADVSRRMSREMLLVTPKKAYLEPVYDTSVAGRLVSERPTATEKPQKGLPNFSELKPNSSRLTNENREALQRILRGQNSGNP